MSEQLSETGTVTKLDEVQFNHLLIAFGNVIRELNSIAFKVKELEGAMGKIEAELKLLRIEIADRKGKFN
ncbi:MAG: hypothetical protein GBAus27B_000412 [Mycoplasmataceae bacterium]|nr:MAG: hypothetical protein GBAus27B_000412 [Mycoplasmataceae bacterium]